MVIKAIVNRRSVREYTPEDVDDAKVQTMLKAAQYAPTAMNNRSLEYVVVRDRATKEALHDLMTRKQPFLKEAPVLIVPTIDPTKSVTPVQDLSIASENIFLQATELGLGTVWKNLPPQEAEGVKKLLGIPADRMAINIIPVGHPKAKPQPHDESEYQKGRIHYDNW
jgi:nitroreductase